MSEDQGLVSWGDTLYSPKTDGVGAVSDALAQTEIAETAETAKTAETAPPQPAISEAAKTHQPDPSDDKEKEDEGDLPVRMYRGLHPEDKDAPTTLTDSSGADVSNIYRTAHRFDELGLNDALLKGVAAMKFAHPSKIQAQALPVILSEDRPNFIGQAHHGSGKTAAYSLCMLASVDEKNKYPQVICVCPVRELARQVAEVIRELGQFSSTEVFLSIPGCHKNEIQEQIVVGTPGKVLEKIRTNHINPKLIRMFVIDEADQMIDKLSGGKSGLAEQNIKIKNLLNTKCQIMLFSATFDDRVGRFSGKVAPKAKKILVKREALSLDAIKQFYLDCGSEANKYQCLTDLYGAMNIGSSIIFVQRVETAKTLCSQMRNDGYTVSLLHGKDMQNEERDRVMDDFRAGNTSVLITTNVLARGIDVLQVTLVINYDIPLNKQKQPDAETYIHRIGRSGRFGRKGVAINFIHDAESKFQLIAIAQKWNKDIHSLPPGDVEQQEMLIRKALAE